MASNSLVQVRVDTELRDDANRLFDALGLDMSTAIKIFLKKCLAENGIPFAVTLDEPPYASPRGMAALAELRREAEANGASNMSLDDINAEIAATRAERRAALGDTDATAKA